MRVISGLHNDYLVSICVYIYMLYLFTHSGHQAIYGGYVMFLYILFRYYVGFSVA